MFVLIKFNHFSITISITISFNILYTIIILRITSLLSLLQQSSILPGPSSPLPPHHHLPYTSTNPTTIPTTIPTTSHNTEAVHFVNPHNKDLLIHVLHNMTINCSAIGNPKPQFTWYKNGDLMENINNNRTYFSEDKSEMTIYNIEVSIFRIYFRNIKVD